MKVAIIHDWLTVYAGAERVLEQILVCYPDADLFSMVDFLDDDQRHFLNGKAVTTSFIQNMPFARSKYRHYLPLMPLAVEQLDLSAYEMIISISSAVAKGVITGPDQLHIAYVNSPMRYAWDLRHQYLRESGLERGIKAWFAKWVLHKMRIWDLRTANDVEDFIANSHFIERRVWKVYRRTSTVIYPPVQMDLSGLQPPKEDFYLTVSRMVPYKRIDLIVAAFAAMPERKLVVIGDGPDMHKIMAQAGANVTFLGYQSNAVLHDYLRRAKAFVFAAEEDFGIAPVEAQAQGTPVIAFGKGGALETICGLESSQPTGVFFAEQSADAIRSAVALFEQECHRITSEHCIANAQRFSPERFRMEFSTFVEAAWARFKQPRVRASAL